MSKEVCFFLLARTLRIVKVYLNVSGTLSSYARGLMMVVAYSVSEISFSDVYGNPQILIVEL